MKIYILLIVILLSSCTSSDVDYKEIIQEIKEIKEAYKEVKNPNPTPTIEPSVSPKPSIEIVEAAEKPIEEKVILPKTNCENPKSYIKKNDGLKCMGSATRNGSTVCLLPYTLSRKPFKTITDHHNQTFKVSVNQNFENVELVLRNKKRIKLKFAGQHNPVYLFNEKIAREHWRNESTSWDSIKNKAIRLEAFYKEDKVCLKLGD